MPLTAQCPLLPLPVSFSERTPRPEEIRTNVAFLIDDLSLSAESVGFVKKALSQYIEKDFAAGDLIAIVRESAGIGALQDFSSDRSVSSRSRERDSLGARLERAHVVVRGDRPNNGE